MSNDAPFQATATTTGLKIPRPAPRPWTGPCKVVDICVNHSLTMQFDNVTKLLSIRHQVNVFRVRTGCATGFWADQGPRAHPTPVWEILRRQAHHEVSKELRTCEPSKALVHLGPRSSWILVLPCPAFMVPASNQLPLHRPSKNDVFFPQYYREIS